MHQLIRSDNLCKVYGGMVALDQVSLEVNESECLGVFGFSGAGKTTLLRLLAGDETPDSGTVSPVEGSISFAREIPFLDGALTPAESLWLYASLYGIPRTKRRSVIRDTLTLVGLESKRSVRIHEFSPAEEKLLEIGRALLSPSDLCVLDEPMAGLDFGMRRRMWEHLLRLRAHEHKSFIIAVSRPEDAELCDRIVLLHQGRVLATGTPAQLRGVIGQESFVVRQIGSKPSTKPLWAGIVEWEQDESVTIEINPESPPAELLHHLPHNTSAIRMTTRGLDSILEELAAGMGE